MILQQESKLNLRPYKGKTIKQVIGGLAAYEDITKPVSEFVRGLINFLSKRKEDFDFILPEYFFPSKILNESTTGILRLNLNENIELFNNIAFVFENDILKFYHFFVSFFSSMPLVKERTSQIICDIFTSYISR